MFLPILQIHEHALIKFVEQQRPVVGRGDVEEEWKCGATDCGWVM
jgi:hypothetical protein